MNTSRLTEALQWLGPMTPYTLAAVLKIGVRQVQRQARAAGYHRDARGRVSLTAQRARPERPCLRAVRELLGNDDGEVYADWVVEQTGYARRAVYEALADLGYTSRRGAGASWVRAMAAK